MKMRTKILLLSVSSLFVNISLAAVNTDESKQLGATLTPWGAEKAGNKEGTIPAYTGEPIKVPAGFDPANPGQYVDPFAGEKPLFVITAQNYTQYADKLDGMVEVFKKYPNYRMDVYPSHRNTVFPKYFLDNSVKNATSCKAVTGGLILEGCYPGLPFPIPKTGNELMWNHVVGFQSRNVGGTIENWVTPVGGAPVLQVRTTVSAQFPYYDPNRTVPWPSDAVYYRVRVQDSAPARMAGGTIVLVDPLDMINKGRRAWQYIPGQRRVKLAPDLAYDTPSPQGGGSLTMDDNNIFMGSQDRFDFKLVGKKEKFIPYNNFALHDFKTCQNEKMASNRNFPLPSCVRWELHRVWVLKAAVKPQFRHVYKTRDFYFDEDATATGMAENYDAAGKLYRIIVGTWLPFYQAPGGAGGAPSFFSLDLQTGIVGSFAMGGCDEKCGYHPGVERPEAFFSPDAMAGEGIR